MTWAAPQTSPEARGYGSAHRALRERWARVVASGAATCCRCGRPIRPDQAWHLDHAEDRTAYRGPSHAHCNLAAAGRKGRAVAARRRYDRTLGALVSGRGAL